MPTSNPLPPKENALFKRILVSGWVDDWILTCEMFWVFPFLGSAEHNILVHCIVNICKKYSSLLLTIAKIQFSVAVIASGHLKKTTDSDGSCLLCGYRKKPTAKGNWLFQSYSCSDPGSFGPIPFRSGQFVPIFRS